jgi:uncharacterized protein (DUF2141 family)
MKNIIFSILFTFFSLVALSQSLTIEFNNIRNDQGLMYVTVYPSEDLWLDDIDELEHIFPKENIVNGKMSVTIDEMQTGNYGVAIMDDENGDGEMKYNFIGMPREGYGFSRNYKVKLSKPDFEECVLEFKNDTTIRITVQYM